MSAIPNYRVEVKVRNNRLWHALVAKVQPFISVLDACKKLGLGPTMVGRALNMQHDFRSRHKSLAHIPKAERPYTKGAYTIAKALDVTPDYLFELELYDPAQVPHQQVFEIIDKQHAQLCLPKEERPDELYEKKALVELCNSAMCCLKPAERLVLEYRFGLNGEGEHTLAEIAHRLGKTPERARQIEARALRKLRHPFAGYKLKTYVDRDFNHRPKGKIMDDGRSY